MLKDIELEQAQEIVMSRARALSAESVPLLHALGRFVAEDIKAEYAMPPTAQAAMDGYAVSSLTPGRYQVIERLGPTQVSRALLVQGQAVQVVTGGVLPEGTVAVVQEEAVQLEDEYIVCNQPLENGENIKPIGENFLTGDLLIFKGACFSPGMASVLGSYGKNKVQLYRQPKVALLNLGGDIVSCEETPALGQMRDSNAMHLAGLIMQEKGLITETAAAGREDLAQKGKLLAHMLDEADIVITIGGAAHGETDQAYPLIESSGAEILFWGVQIKPGSHTGASLLGDKWIITLPGNPSACAVSYHLIVAPLLRAMQGQSPCYKTVQALCADKFTKKGGPRRFLLATALAGAKGWRVSILPGQKSSMTKAFLGKCNALIDLPAGHPPVAKGEEVAVILL